MTNLTFKKIVLHGTVLVLVLAIFLPATASAYVYRYDYNYTYSGVRQTPTISSSDYFARERLRWASKSDAITPVVSISEAFDRGDADRSFSDDTDVGAGSLEIFDIVVINPDLDPESKDAVFSNCNIEIHWQTNEASVGQVIYGTESQAKMDVEDVKYANSASTGSEFKRTHAVRLDCLSKETYYFRVVSFSQTEMKMSSERILVPFGGVVIPVEGSIDRDIDTSGGASASALGTIGRVSIPVLFLIFLIVIGYLIIKWVRGVGNGDGNGNGGLNSTELDEPVINISTGQSQ